MNLPNKLTVMRIILVPFFVAVLLIPQIPHHYFWATILFVAAALTDHYDGKLARKNNQVTNFGKFLDPLADKILVVSALVCFVDLRLAASWSCCGGHPLLFGTDFRSGKRMQSLRIQDRDLPP